MGLDLHPARPATEDERDYWGSWYYDPSWPWPHWSYSGFGRFRERLATFEGFALDEMKGFGGARDWGEVTTDLAPLLNHSDCDGEMTPAECAQVAPRLEGVIQAWAIAGDPEFAYNIQAARTLVAAMSMVAADSNLTLIFR